MQKQLVKRKADATGTDKASKTMRSGDSVSLASTSKRKPIPQVKLESIVDKMENIVIDLIRDCFKKVYTGKIKAKVLEDLDSIFVIVDFTSDSNKEGVGGYPYCVYHIPARCVTPGQCWILDVVQMIGMYDSITVDFVVAWFLDPPDDLESYAEEEARRYMDICETGTLEDWKVYFFATCSKFFKFKLDPQSMTAPLRSSTSYMYFLRSKDDEDGISDDDGYEYVLEDKKGSGNEDKDEDDNVREDKDKDEDGENDESEDKKKEKKKHNNTTADG